MKLIIGKTAGFCFGVKKAVETAENLANNNNLVYSLGPLIHNSQEIERLRKKGIQTADEITEIPDNSKVVIRAHGISPDIVGKLKEKNCTVIDATCPYVKKIQMLVKKKYDDGYRIIIAGDKNHPEVLGIKGWCEEKADIVYDATDIDKIIEDIEDADGIKKINAGMPVCAVAQTTIAQKRYDFLVEIMKKKFQNFEKYDTICSATAQRQTEAADIAQKSDLMIVIGGKNSSNTARLFEISGNYCSKTYWIESPEEIDPVDIPGNCTAGIMAGASTPDWIIKEVKDKMEEMTGNEREMSFKDVFEDHEKNLVSVKNGDVVKGRVMGFKNNEIYVDLGYKSDGVIPVYDYSSDPDFNPQTDIKPGEEIEVFVVRVNDGEGNIQVSRKKVESIRGWSVLEHLFESREPVVAKITEITNGGAIAYVSGVKVFIPASQLSDRFIKDLNSFLKKEVEIRIIEVNRQKRKVIGSAKVLLNESRQQIEEAFWSNAEIGKKYKGTVKSIMDFGVFVDIGGVDGLVHISELSWDRIKHPSSVVNTGDIIEVSLIDFDREKKKISLGYRKLEDNPWHAIEERYKEGDIIEGKVVRIVPFGAFIGIENGVEGLVHISRISDHRLAKPQDALETGMTVKAKILDVNKDNKKINLSIKEVEPMIPFSKLNTRSEKGTETVELKASTPEVTGMEGKTTENADRAYQPAEAIDAKVETVEAVNVNADIPVETVEVQTAVIGIQIESAEAATDTADIAANGTLRSQAETVQEENAAVDTHVDTIEVR